MICDSCKAYEKAQVCRLCSKPANSVQMPKADLNKDLLCFRCASVPRCFNCGKGIHQGQLKCSSCDEELEFEHDYAG